MADENQFPTLGNTKPKLPTSSLGHSAALKPARSPQQQVAPANWPLCPFTDTCSIHSLARSLIHGSWLMGELDKPTDWRRAEPSRAEPGN